MLMQDIYGITDFAPLVLSVGIGIYKPQAHLGATDFAPLVLKTSILNFGGFFIPII